MSLATAKTPKGEPVTVPLSKEDLKAWAEQFPPSLHPPDQVLFYKGHFAHGLYILEWGSILLTPNERGSGSGERVKAPAVLGFQHILHDQPYPVTAITASEAAISFVPKSLLKDHIKQKDPLLRSLLKLFPPKKHVTKRSARRL